MEHSLDIKFQAKMTGLDPTRMLYFNPTTLTGEQVLDAILAFQKEEDIGMIILDSIPALLPAQALENDMEKDPGMRGTIAKPLHRFLIAMSSLVNERNNIFIMINRYIKEGKKSGSEIQNEIDRATHYFNENYNKPLNIDEYAESRHMSTCWFIRSFKQILKVTPMQYILSLRMANAQSLLETTEYNISEIAEAVGYDNALYFSRLFHKHVGVSPSEYRKMRSGR